MQKLRKASIPTIAASFIAFFIVLLVTRANPAFFPLALIPILFAAILLGIKGGTASSLVAMALVSLMITKEQGLPWPPGYGSNMLAGFLTYALTGFLAGYWSTTERRRAKAEEEIKHRAEESETLRKAGSLVAATLDPEEAVSRILEQLEQVVPHDSASVQLLRDGELEIVGGRGWPEPSSVIGIRFPVPGDNPNSIVIQTCQPYVLDETGKVYPAFRQPPHSHIRSWLGVPLIVHNQVTGLLAIDSAKPHHFTREHVQMAAAFADQVAIALENAHLFGSTQKQSRRQAALLQLSADLAVALDEQDICKRAVHHLHDMLGFDYVAVFLAAEDSGDRVLQVGIGLPDQPIPERMPPGQGLSERPLLDGQLHYTPDVTKESNYIPGNNGSEVDVPIRIGEEVKGVLIVESARLHAFSQNDCDVLNTAANLIGLALTRAELFASEHRQFEELAVLHSIAMAMTEAKNVDELIERTTQLIGEKLFPDNFGILLLDETANVLHLHSTYRLGIHAEQFSVPVGQGITGAVAKTGQPRRVADVSKDQDYISVDSRIQSEICVPLKIGGQVIGVINAESAKLNAFAVADERLLTTLASQLAIGIERLRAVEEIYQHATTLARSNALISALAQVAARIETASDLDGVLQTLGEEVKKLDLTCLVALFVPGTSDLVLRYTTLDKQRLRILERAGGHKIDEFHFPADRLSPYADLTQHLRPTILQDPIALVTNVLEGFPRSVVERVLEPTGMTKDTPVGHLPLVVEERVLGLLWLWGENLKEPDLAAMSIFANQVAMAIERKRAEEALVAERSLLRTLIDHLPDAIYVKDAACRKTLANPVDVRNMGASSEAEALGKTDFDFFPHDLAAAFYADDQSVIRSGRPMLNREEMITLPDRTIGWQATSKVPVRDSAGQVIGLVGIDHDITERKRAEEEIKQHNQELASLNRASQAITSSLDIREVLDQIVDLTGSLVNAAYTSIVLIEEDGSLGISAENFQEGSPLGSRARPQGITRQIIASQQPLVFDDVSNDGTHNPAVVAAGVRSYAGLPVSVKGKVLGVLFVHSHTPGAFHDRLPLLTTFANQVAVAIENARLFAEVQNLAITDPLTGLYNRRGLFELGRIEFARTRRFGRPFASMMLDIDHFKRVNDAYGHPVGDQVLQALAKHCQSSVREIDLVARYGGEEFVFLLPETNLEVAREIAERLRRTIANLSIPTEKGELSVTVSLGVAMYDENTLGLETMIARTDQAMYVAKHRGRNRIAVSR